MSADSSRTWVPLIFRIRLQLIRVPVMSHVILPVIESIPRSLYQLIETGTFDQKVHGG